MGRRRAVGAAAAALRQSAPDRRRRGGRNRPRAAARPLPDARHSDSIFDQPLSSEPPPPGAPRARHPLRRPAASAARCPMPASRISATSSPRRRARRRVGAGASDPLTPMARWRRQPLDLGPSRAHERAQFDRSEPRMSTSRSAEPQPCTRISPSRCWSRRSRSTIRARPRPRRGAARRRSRRRKTATTSTGRAKRGRAARMRDLIQGRVALGIIVARAIGRRAGLAMADGWSRLYRSFRAPATEVARDSSAPAAPKKTQERVEPGSQQPAVHAQRRRQRRRWRRRWCSTRRIPPIPTASASSARRSGGPRP